MNTSDSSFIVILSSIFFEPDVKNCPSLDLTKLLTTNSSWTFATTVEKFLGFKLLSIIYKSPS